MTRDIKISVIITTFNKEKFISNTVNSCLNQTFKNFEIIIVDTGSKDKTKNLLMKYRDQEKIKIFFISRKYKTSALNQMNAIKHGLRFCSGKVICLLDGDDLFHKNKLQFIHNFFKENKSLLCMQDVPEKLVENEIYKYKLKKFYLFKKWEQFYPTSTFSICKSHLLQIFNQINSTKYDLLEIDLRLFFFYKIFKKKHIQTNLKLTYYVSDKHGISSKYKKFSKDWFNKRLQSHLYLKELFNNENYPYKVDFIFTKIINIFLK